MMAASSKFDLSSSSSDGTAHPNGQHRPNVSASLERPGSFRRNSENSGSTSNVSRGGSLSSQVDVGNLLQNLITDLPTTVLEPSLPRTGDVRRSISSIIGVSQDDSLTSTVTARPLPSSSFEGIRRLKSTLIEDSAKARDRAKIFGEAALKMNKCSNNMSKKRSRTDISSGERANPAVANGSSSKMGSHSHLSGRSFENGSQKAEERVKGGILNKKIGTFSEERVDVRPSKMTRPSVAAERNKDVFKPTNSSVTTLEEKSRVLPAAIDGWVKPRTRKKRSSIKSDIPGIAVPSRPNDNDRESSKRGLQPKLTVEGRSRMNNTHGFRVNGSEDSYSASPNSTMKMNASPRAPRLNPGAITKTSSPGTNRTPEISDEWDQQNYKLNRKRTVTACASSPPQPQWCATRTKKGTRVGRRSNLPPVVSIRDEYSMSVTQTTAVNEDNMGNMRRPSSNASIQSKSRNDLISSDCEDYVAVENKCKETIKKCSEIEEKTFKVAAVPPIRRNKIVNEEEQKRRKMSRVAVVPSRSGVSIEKLDVDVNAKQISTSGIDYEKFDSRSGRQLTKKSSDRKGHSRPRSDTHSLEFVGESDDDHEELLAAVNAALDSVRHACLPPQPPKTHDQKSFSGKGKTKTQSFWEQNEDFFAFLSMQDQDFLAQQIHLSEDAASYLYDSGDCQNLKGGIDCDSSVPSNSMLSSSNGTISKRELIMSNQSEHLEPFLKDSVIGNGAQTRLPISQVLLSAIIDYEEIDGYSHKINIEDQSYDNAHGLPIGDIPTFYSYKADDCRNYHDELELDNLGSNGFIDDLVSRPTATSNPACTEFQYSQMCTDEKILLELNSIGVYPDSAPCLAPSDDEDVDECINRLMRKLHEQASKNKKTLLGLEKVVKEEREIQGRELERIALDKLVGRAYEKYMACWGPKASGSKNSNRANKQAAVGFIRRTFARCRKYEDTGTGCFGEPPFRDMLYSVSSQKDNSRILTDSHPSTSDRNSGLPSQSTRKDYNRGSFSDAYQSINQLTEQSNGREDHWSNKLKKKELLLDEVVGSATDILRASSSFGNGTKGKRSDRDRDGKGQNRESTSKNGNAKSGRTSSSNAKGERKPKSKPKQKMTPINGLLSNSTESPSTVGLDISMDEAVPVSCFPDIANDASAMDFGEFGDFGAQAQDIDSWLNIEDEHLQDDDFMGLEIPMDDLSEVMF